jgi:DNA-binding NarL/FixJ family response regulator
MSEIPPPSISPNPSASPTRPLHVLLADDHRLLLEGLTNLLEAHGIRVVGAAKDGLEAITLAQATQPDVILMDISMPGCDGLEATRRIKAVLPDQKIVILTTSTEDQDLFDAVKSGACGYLLKSMDAEELVECLNQVHQGIPPFSAGLAAKLLEEFSRLAASAPADSGNNQAEGSRGKSEIGLTARQYEVLSLVAQGLSYKETGARLGLSPRTIKYHMAEILETLHLSNRSQVLAYAGKIGLGSKPSG